MALYDTIHHTLGIEEPLGPDTADAIYDQIAELLAEAGFRPRAHFDRLGITALIDDAPNLRGACAALARLIGLKDASDDWIDRRACRGARAYPAKTESF